MTISLLLNLEGVVCANLVWPSSAPAASGRAPSRRAAAKKQEVCLVICSELLLIIISQSGNQEFLCSAVTLDCLARGITVLDIAGDQ